MVVNPVSPFTIFQGSFLQSSGGAQEHISSYSSFTSPNTNQYKGKKLLDVSAKSINFYYISQKFYTWTRDHIAY